SSLLPYTTLFRSVRLQCFEPGADRGLPRCPARHWRQQSKPPARRSEESGVIGMDNRLNQGNAGVVGQSDQARSNGGLAQELTVLFGQIPARAQPPARCHDDGCDVSGHVLLLEDDVGPWLYRVAAAPQTPSRSRRRGGFRL